METKNEVTVHLTDREQEALNELAITKDISPERVLVQALRLYQLIEKGGAELVYPASHLKKSKSYTKLG